MTWKCENWKWPLVWLSPNISASTQPKFKIKDSFEILRTSRFQNWSYFLNLVKIWWKYWPKTNCCVFLGHGVFWQKKTEYPIFDLSLIFLLISIFSTKYFCSRSRFSSLMIKSYSTNREHGEHISNIGRQCSSIKPVNEITNNDWNVCWNTTFGNK